MPARPTSKVAIAGDPAQWVDRYGDVLLRFASGRVSGHEVAEDLVQETFLAAYRNRGQFDGKSEFSTWLIAILRRKIADHYRRAGREPESVDESGEGFNQFTDKGRWIAGYSKWRATPAQLAEDAEFWQVVRGCLDDMPPQLAQAFQVREFGAASIEEVGRLTGISAKNVAVRLHRARLLLRQCLDRKWFGSERGAAS